MSVFTLSLFILISLTEIKPAINHLIVINEKCLHWKAEKYEEDTEIYKVRQTFISILCYVLYLSTMDYLFTSEGHKENRSLLLSCACAFGYVRVYGGTFYHVLFA